MTDRPKGMEWPAPPKPPTPEAASGLNAGLGGKRMIKPVCCLCGVTWHDGHDCVSTTKRYEKALEMIATVNACDYEYQRWAREALGRA